MAFIRAVGLRPWGRTEQSEQEAGLLYSSSPALGRLTIPEFRAALCILSHSELALRLWHRTLRRHHWTSQSRCRKS